MVMSHLANKSFDAPNMRGPSPRLMDAHPLHVQIKKKAAATRKQVGHFNS
jgi:hypothetical protein